MIMFKKSFIAVLSAMAISATCMAATASAAVLDTDNNTNIVYTEAAQSSMDEIRHIPQRLASLMSGVQLTSNYTPIYSGGATSVAAYQNAMNQIKGSHSNLYYHSDWCYSQKDINADYSTSNPSWSCPTYALATALSIMNKARITPKSIADQDGTDGTGTKWNNHGAIVVTSDLASGLTESEILLAIDAQLEMGRPAIIHVYTIDAVQHWATVIGKDNTKTSVGEKYTIIDPANGTKCSLNQMAYYNGSNIEGYAILSDTVAK